MNDEHWETPWFVQGGVSKQFPIKALWLEKKRWIQSEKP